MTHRRRYRCSRYPPAFGRNWRKLIECRTGTWRWKRGNWEGVGKHLVVDVRDAQALAILAVWEIGGKLVLQTAAIPVARSAKPKPGSMREGVVRLG